MQGWATRILFQHLETLIGKMPNFGWQLLIGRPKAGRSLMP